MASRVFLLFCMIVSMAVSPAFADEKDDAFVKKTQAELEALMKRVGEEEQRHFYTIYSNYNLIGTVQVVQRDVGKAIAKCEENNPDMKDDLEARHASWLSVVDPLIKDARASIDNMVIAQDYVSKEFFERVFAAVDQTRRRTQDEINKIPVSTPEACTYLINKMDETQEKMVSMLRSTLISYPQALKSDAETKPDAEQPSE